MFQLGCWKQLSRRSDIFLVKNEIIRFTEASGRLPEPGGELWESLIKIERQYTFNILKATSGIIFGSRGASKILRLPRLTLLYRTKELGLGGQDGHAEF
ncbi:MAG: hypothetical protein AMR96_02145 [Candidatus Adiutrix intracellularis]|nr:MAG: hypothetical protein AMR96_02145 [Candidatus Adiutrix intracellularis]